MSWQHGEKAGISQFVNGASNRGRAAEKTDAYEIGLKTVSAQLTRWCSTRRCSIRKSRTTSSRCAWSTSTPPHLNVANGVTPSIAYTSATGNVPLRRCRGVEIDGVYAGIPEHAPSVSRVPTTMPTTRDFPNLAQPVRTAIAGAPAIACQRRNSAGLVQVRLQSRYRLSRAVLGRSSSTPVPTRAWQSKFNSDVALSAATRGSRPYAGGSVAWASARAARFPTLSLLLRTRSTTTRTCRRPGTATARRSRAGGAWCSAAKL